MAPHNPILICVVGPTAIGKTAMAIKLAQAHKTEIISADSRQIFKEMRIGTAVPSAQELAAVPHHFIQTRSIFDDYSVGDFETEALSKLKMLFKNHDKVVMVGGSGLYVDAVVKGLDTFPEIPSHFREGLKTELAERGLSPLQRELERKDPEYFEEADVQNPHRVLRALEIIRATGQPFSFFRKGKFASRLFETVFIGLDAPRDTVYRRINNRVDQMVAHGLVEEAKTLYDHRDRNALQTVGYRELFDYFDGKLGLEEAISEIKKNTRRFAKRQNTWFKKNDAIKWFHYQTEPEEILRYINEKNAS